MKGGGRVPIPTRVHTLGTLYIHVYFVPVGYAREANPDHLVQHEAGACHLHQRHPLCPSSSNQVRPSTILHQRHPLCPPSTNQVRPSTYSISRASLMPLEHQPSKTICNSTSTASPMPLELQPSKTIYILQFYIKGIPYAPRAPSLKPLSS